MQTPQHAIITGIVIVIIAFLLAAFFIVILVSYYNQRKKKYIQEKEILQNKFKQELLQTQLEIQEQTLQNISQEIHDNIGQALSFIKLNINMIDLDQRKSTEEKLGESKLLLTKVIQDLRDLARMLNTDYIKETGLPKAIEQQLTILEKTGMYETELKVMGDPCKYELQRELVAFRIVQELLNNIVKHAAATSIRVLMDYRADHLEIAVADNGKGFTKIDSKEGLGLRNIVNRIQLVNGTVDFKSTPDKGTTITIQLFKNNEI